MKKNFLSKEKVSPKFEKKHKDSSIPSKKNNNKSGEAGQFIIGSEKATIIKPIRGPKSPDIKPKK